MNVTDLDMMRGQRDVYKARLARLLAMLARGSQPDDLRGYLKDADREAANLRPEDFSTIAPLNATKTK